MILRLTLPSNKKEAVLTVCFLTNLILSILFVGLFPKTSVLRYEGENSEKIDEQLLQMAHNEVVTAVIKLRDEFYQGLMGRGLTLSELEVEIRESQRAVKSFLESRGALILNTFWLGNYILANVTAEILYEISALDYVERVFPNFEVEILDDFTDGEVIENDVVNVTWGLHRIGAPKAWAMGFNGSGIRVCVIDTGVDVSHPDIAGKMFTDNISDPTYPGGWIEFDEYGRVVAGSVPHDTHGHGTHVSGTIVGGNASGVAIGVAPASKLMHALALPGGRGTFAQCVAAMQWAIAPFDQYGKKAGEKAHVVSMSWGARGYFEELIEPIQNMEKAGVIPVASIGNSGEGTSGSPGNIYECFGIGAIDKFDKVAGFSGGQVVDWPASYSEPYIKPDFTAPGVNVYSSVPYGGYRELSGTSMATPHVAATVALILQASSKLTVDDVYTLLKLSATDLGSPGKDVRYGWGVINATRSVELSSFNCGVEGFVLDSETHRPVRWGATVNVSAVEWGTQETDISGHYRIFLLPGTYSITVTAFGYYEQTTTFEVIKHKWTEVNFTLKSLPRGFINGTVVDSETNTPIENATISLMNTPLEPFLTNETGYYILEVPIGTYNVDCWAWGYKPSIIYGLTVLEKGISTANFKLQPTIKVGVIGDFQNQVTDLLMRNISAHERGWDIIQVVQHYDVVIVNIPSDPGEQKFLELIRATDEHRIGVIFTSTWPGRPYGISLLRKYVGDPKGTFYASDRMYYEVVVNHPIFDGWNVGDKILIINGGWFGFAWFYDYSGVTIAKVWTNQTGSIGGGVAYSIRPNGNVHLLLAGLSQCENTHIRNAWTEEARKIFINAVRWASDPKSFKPSLSLDPAVTAPATYVRVQGSGFAPKQKVKVMLNGTLALEILSDLNGNFNCFLKLPQTGPCFYMVEAVDAYGNRAEASVRVIVDTHSLRLKVGWNLIGLSSNVPVKVEELIVYYDGQWFNWTEACANKIVLGYVYWWNGSYLMVDELEPGKGYWMYAYKPCEIFWQVSEMNVKEVRE